jgi:hypothetical protein
MYRSQANVAMLAAASFPSQQPANSHSSSRCWEQVTLVWHCSLNSTDHLLAMHGMAAPACPSIMHVVSSSILSYITMQQRNVLCGLNSRMEEYLSNHTTHAASTQQLLHMLWTGWTQWFAYHSGKLINSHNQNLQWCKLLSLKQNIPPIPMYVFFFLPHQINKKVYKSMHASCSRRIYEKFNTSTANAPLFCTNLLA